MLSGQKLRINQYVTVSLHIFPGTCMNSIRNCYDIFHPVYNTNMFIYLTTEHFSFSVNIFCVLSSYTCVTMTQNKLTPCHHLIHVCHKDTNYIDTLLSSYTCVSQ
jgi:hypothetical protein